MSAAWLEDDAGVFGVPKLRVPLGVDDGPLELIAGRSRDADLHVPSGDVSRHHATLRRDRAGAWWLAVTASSSGTFVNGLRVPPSAGGRRLVDGDGVALGGRPPLRFRAGPADDLVGSCFSVAGRLVFAEPWPASRRFALLAVTHGGDIHLGGAALVVDDLPSRAAESVLWRGGGRCLVEDGGASGPTLARIERVSRAAGRLDPEVAGAILAALPGAVAGPAGVAVGWDGVVTAVGEPRERPAAEVREVDRALIAGVVQNLFPDEHRRAVLQREQMFVRPAEEWRDLIARSPPLVAA